MAQGEDDGVRPGDPEDPYEDHPSDDEADVHDPKVSLKVATHLKNLGTSSFKSTDFEKAARKYHKALKYLDVHPVVPPMDLAKEPELENEFFQLRVSVLLNLALSNVKLATTSDLPLPKKKAAARQAVQSTTRVLGLDGPLNPADPENSVGTVKLTNGQKAKAYYRRALAKLALGGGEEDEALKDLVEANKLEPGDAGIQKELKVGHDRSATPISFLHGPKTDWIMRYWVLFERPRDRGWRIGRPNREPPMGRCSLRRRSVEEIRRRLMT